MSLINAKCQHKEDYQAESRYAECRYVHYTAQAQSCL
jgi:hypothetical protein